MHAAPHAAVTKNILNAHHKNCNCSGKVQSIHKGTKCDEEAVEMEDFEDEEMLTEEEDVATVLRYASRLEGVH